jgi:hypothetical protein
MRIEPIEKGNIYNIHDIQVAIKILKNDQINSQLVWDYHHSLVKLVEHKELNRYGCQVPEKVRVMKLLISCQEWELNIHL